MPKDGPIKSDIDVKVSVIVPVYNGYSFIQEAILSVWNQTRPADEIIVVDDGSTDGSDKIIEQLKLQSPVPFKHIRQNNRGSAASRNVAVRAASGDVISFIDVDDIWNKDYLKIQLSHLNSTDNPGYVICHFLSFLDEEVIGEQKEKPHWVRKEHLDKPQPGYLPSCFVVKRSVFEKLGMFNEGLRFVYDMNWFKMSRDIGIPFSIEKAVLVNRRIHLNNKTRNIPQLQKYVLKVVRAGLKRNRE